MAERRRILSRLKQIGRAGLVSDWKRSETAVMGLRPGTRLSSPFKRTTEVESGKRTTGPALHQALNQCRLLRATLVIAKTRSPCREMLTSSLALDKAGVEFLAVDMPNANRLTVGIMALVAEEERRMISARTKAALGAAKARG